MRLRILAICLLAGMFTTPTLTLATPYSTFGAPDCGQWTTSATPIRKAWLLGFMSGMAAKHAALGATPPDPLNALSSGDQILVWMNNYCKNQPLSTVNEGGEKLFNEISTRKK